MDLLLLLIILLHLELIAIAIYWLLRSRTGKRPCFVDTSVLIDGRIASAVEAGFVPANMLIPRSVLTELQLLADGSDSEKRLRARHGLDIAAALTSSRSADISVYNDKADISEGVDERLIALAKKHRGSICTIDFNLNKVAAVEGIAVLNINELAQQLRMNYLPGEKVSLKIQQKGDNPNQGVGYMADGTMVVVEQAASMIGSVIEVEFIRSLQTVAGRMLFAKTDARPARTQAAGATGRKAPNVAAQGRKQNRTKSNGPRQARSVEDSMVALARENGA